MGLLMMCAILLVDHATAFKYEKCQFHDLNAESHNASPACLIETPRYYALNDDKDDLHHALVWYHDDAQQYKVYCGRCVRMMLDLDRNESDEAFAIGDIIATY